MSHNFKDDDLKNIWESIQKNDVAGLQTGLNKSGFHGERAERARDTMKTLASQASDYQNFVGLVQGEIQVRNKLSVQEVGSLAPAGAAARWEGNGGRTWEGSASVASPAPATSTAKAK